MKDQQQHSSPVSSGDLSARLREIKKSNSLPNHGDAIARFSHRQQPGTTPSSSSTSSFSSSSDTESNSLDMSRFPAFTESATTSTSGSEESNGVGRLHIMRPEPLTRTQMQSVSIAPGNFSKPRLQGARQRRSNSSNSRKSADGFQYYGRHANSWLFNDFSISGTVRKGFGKVFWSRGEKEDEVEREGN